VNHDEFPVTGEMDVDLRRIGPNCRGLPECLDGILRCEGPRAAVGDDRNALRAIAGLCGQINLVFSPSLTRYRPAR
jgi:hypothetical protein